MAVTCPVCRRYSSKFNTEADLLDHLTEIHPNDPETQARLDRTRVASYGAAAITGKVKPAEKIAPPPR